MPTMTNKALAFAALTLLSQASVAGIMRSYDITLSPGSSGIGGSGLLVFDNGQLTDDTFIQVNFASSVLKWSRTDFDVFQVSTDADNLISLLWIENKGVSPFLLNFDPKGSDPNILDNFWAARSKDFQFINGDVSISLRNSIPEPTSLALLGLGLLGMGYARRMAG